MIRVVVIGVGQLGSRHLQGIKKSRLKLEIWAIDSDKHSLEIAKERFEQVLQVVDKKIHYADSLDVLPGELDIVIVATSSKPRAAIINNLLCSRQVKFMILEKFLFTKLSDYDQVERLLVQTNTLVFVNTPRRLWSGYQEIKGKLNSDSPIHLVYQGSKWGLCCNSIHFFDLFQYLTGSDNFAVDVSELLPSIQQSKRVGYIELNGTILITTERGDVLTLTCHNDAPSLMVLEQDNLSIVIDEGKNEYLINGKAYNLGVQYQSDLTGVVVDDLLTIGRCDLPTYELSANLHKLFLTQILSFVNQLQGTYQDNCPIT